MKPSYAWITLSALCILLIPGFSPAQQNLIDLTKQLTDMQVKGKAGTNLILNRGIRDSLDVEQNDVTRALALSLGFIDGDGNTGPACITLPLSIPDWLGEVKKLHAAGKLKTVSYIDIGSPIEALQAGLKATREKWKNNDVAFRDYLRGVQFDASAAGLNSLDDAKLTFDDKSPVMAYFTKRFLVEKNMEQMRLYQAELVKLQPTLSLGGPYAGNFEQNTDALMLDAWRNKVFTPWVAERSWLNGEFSPQVLGYYLAIARAAGSRNPILADLHVGTGNYAAGIRRSFYLALAQGAKGIRFVGAVPPELARGKETLATDQVDSWKTIRQLTHEAGLYANVLQTTRTRVPDVAILVSLTQELYDPSTWVHEERKAIYQACRMGGHNVIIVNEEDLQDGKIQKLSTVILVGNHIQRQTAKVLKAWVNSGATISCVGGPFLDEYNKPLPDMLEIAGLTDATWKNIAAAGPAKITLAQQKPYDTIKWKTPGKDRDFPAVYGKLTVTPDEAQKNKFFPFGRFEDGSPAVIKFEYEPVKLGHVWTFCAPLGSGWLRTSLLGRKWVVGDKPDSYNHQILFQYLDGDAGDIVTSSTGDARWDVITDNLSVETVLLEGENKYIMICINWANKPQKAWLTTQFIPKELTKAVSMNSGPLATQRVGVTLSLPKSYTVDVADLVILE